jgi:hypothetical protein
MVKRKSTNENERKVMKMRLLLGVLGAAGVLCASGGSLLAQDDNDGPPPGGFDPAQFQKRMQEQVRKNLDITNDEDWAAVQPLVQKVMDARRQAREGGGPGMFGPGPGGPGGFGGPGGPPPDGGPGGPGGGPPDGGPDGPGGPGGPFGPPQSAERQALQKAIADRAPSTQVKEALASYRASRQEKQAQLEAAQANLKSVLTGRQEAAAVLMGLVQ